MPGKIRFVVQEKRRDAIKWLDLSFHSQVTPEYTISDGENRMLQRLIGLLQLPRMRNPIEGLRSIVGYSNGKAKKRIAHNEASALYFIFPLLGLNCRMNDFAVQ